jgi:isopentenyl diphosphate isomerase/L-lactate dehydrogenase-like FMN-dependent dehydrogenase
MKNDFNCYNIADIRESARRRLPRGLFEFVDRGTEDEVSLRNNRSVYDRIRFRPRTMVDVSKRSLRTTLFGREYALPIALAPTGSAGLMWYEGEIALAKAARAAGIPFTLSTSSLTAMERVAEEAGGDLWFQLYLWPDRSMSQQLVERAKASGYKVLIVTVDGATSGNREYNIRNGFTVPFSVTTRNFFDIASHPRWLLGVMARYMMTTGMPMFENYPLEARAKMTAGPMGRASLRSDSVSWDDLAALRKIWPHQLIVKGMLDPSDAR